MQDVQNVTEHCKFDISSLGPCSEPPYGYDKFNKPCLYLKFNRVLDLKLNLYDKNSELPNSMPQEIKSKIRNNTISVSIVEALRIFKLL